MVAWSQKIRKEENPVKPKYTQETLSYHAARLLLLFRFCGKPRRSKFDVLPGIEGRTLLAKLDFFLRYPGYLKKASEILENKITDEDLGLVPDNELHTVESRMIRYLYGPWDNIYYPTIAYLIGKELIIIERQKGVETFRLTGKGFDLANDLSQNVAFHDLSIRADTIYHLFNAYSGSRLKAFIYTNFPEVVNRRLGELI